MTEIAFGESPRWHGDQIWFADWAAGQVIRLGKTGEREVVASVRSFPLCFGFLPDGRMLLVDSTRRQLLVRSDDGELHVHAELGHVSEKPWNDIVVDVDGNAFVNNIGFDFPGGEPGPGLIVRVGLDGSVQTVADDLAFPNGMAITPDGAVLIVAESHANRLTAFDIAPDGELTGRRVWAATGSDHPDGICLDTDGAVWLADVGNKRCVRVREGGDVLDTIELDRGAFACALNRDAENPQLYVVGQDQAAAGRGEVTGQLTVHPAPAPGAGCP